MKIVVKVLWKKDNKPDDIFNVKNFGTKDNYLWLELENGTRWTIMFHAIDGYLYWTDGEEA